MAAIETAESAVKGLRQIIQDLIPPDLREIKAESKGIHGRLDQMDGRFDRLDGRMDRFESRMDRLEQSMNNGFESLRRMLETHADVQLLKERMARVEGERSSKSVA